jgi:Fe-S oxidoreductase
MAVREGNLEAPDRRPIEWRTEEYYDKDALDAELERVYDICHGCRRCVSLCDAFPTLFDLVDNSPTLEVDGVAKDDYMKVVDQCFLCDLCAETKCPYLPPHEWAVDFPHLMLRAKAYRFKQGATRWRDRLITSTDPIFTALSVPGVAQTANAASRNKTLRKVVGERLGFHPDAPLPVFHSRTTSRRTAGRTPPALTPTQTDRTRGKVALYVTCYGEHNEPDVVEDMIAVFEHNGIPVTLLKDASCCGMPKLDLGDLDSVAKLKDRNLPHFLAALDAGHDLIAPVPSCVLMYRQELPLMFPDDAEVQRVADAFFDPFEYLMLRHKAGIARTDFKSPLGKVAYHAACHQRVQNIGSKTREFLSLVPGTEVTTIERCSGHDGTYALKNATYPKAMKIVKPVVNRVNQAQPDHFGSDCPMAGRMIAHARGGTERAMHPISMARKAYGI